MRLIDDRMRFGKNAASAGINTGTDLSRSCPEKAFRARIRSGLKKDQDQVNWEGQCRSMSFHQVSSGF